MKLNSITTKFILITCGIGAAACILISFFLPNLFFQIMKPYFVQHIESIMESNALRLGYIWRSNRSMHAYLQDEAILDLFRQYYSEGADQETLRQEIIASLPDVPDEGVGGDEGAIASSSAFLAVTDRGDFFCRDYAEDTAALLADSDWYIRSLKTGRFETGHIPVITDHGETPSEIAIKAVSFSSGDVSCVLLNTIDFSYISQQLSAFDEFGMNDFLGYSDGRILFQNLEDNSDIDLSLYPSYMFEGAQYDTQVWEDQGLIHFMTLCTYPQDEYRIAVCTSKSVLLAPYKKVFSLLQIVFIAFAALLLVAFLLVLMRISRRIVRLDGEMSNVRSGNYFIQLSDQPQDELGHLATTFRLLLEKIRQSTANEQKMQYSLMVSAVDPHYIYNTLNVVTALARLGRSEDVVIVNTAFIATLKDRLKSKTYKILDTAENEISALKQYMVIQNYLFYPKIELTLSVSEDARNTLIPKNLIQPLAENAIKHGILCREDSGEEALPGLLCVSLRRDGSFFVLEVADNGAGISDEARHTFFESPLPEAFAPDDCAAHIGIFNIRMRLNYLCGGQYQISVKSLPQKGAAVTLRFSLNYRS